MDMIINGFQVGIGFTVGFVLTMYLVEYIEIKIQERNND